MSVDHEKAKEAKRHFADRLDASIEIRDWQILYRDFSPLVRAALSASNNLKDIAAAISDSGAHMRVYRYMLAPALSQDRFRNICEVYSKSKEKSGSGYNKNEAEIIAACVEERLSREARSLRSCDVGRRSPLARALVMRTATLMARQQFETDQRNLSSRYQEEMAIKALKAAGYKELEPRKVTRKTRVPEKHFMHKARLAVSETANQEADIAIGLPDGTMLALECKVSNDETNSVKRANDIIKKYHGWVKYWGSGFAKTGCLLEGVWGHNAVSELNDHDIQIFWSHDLGDFSAEIASPTQSEG